MEFFQGDVVYHKKTMCSYLILNECVIENRGIPAYAYSLLDNIVTTIWIRPKVEMEDGRFVLVTKTMPEMFSLLATRKALELEIKGIKVVKGTTVFIRAKRYLGIKGDRPTILKALTEHIEKCQADIMRTQI